LASVATSQGFDVLVALSLSPDERGGRQSLAADVPAGSLVNLILDQFESV
jgi:hypothetical protein